MSKTRGIGEPGAEKILSFCRAHPIFALESHGLRVLLRLGFGKEQKNYASSYRSVQEAVAKGLKRDCDWLIRAHQLLRQHGQEICRRTHPDCPPCPLTKVCGYYATTTMGNDWLTQPDPELRSQRTFGFVNDCTAQ
jgi:endonuclease-3